MDILVAKVKDAIEEELSELEEEKQAIKSLESSISDLEFRIESLKQELLNKNKDSKNFKDTKKELAKTKKDLRTAKESKKDLIPDDQNIESEIILIDSEIIQTKLDMARFEELVSYFYSVDNLLAYLSNNDELKFSLGGPLSCETELNRSLFFNDAYDIPYKTCKDTKYSNYRLGKHGFDADASAAQFEWDETYNSLTEEHYDGAFEKLNMNQLKFLCVDFNIPRDGNRRTLVERLTSPYELYVPKAKRTDPFETFETRDPKEQMYDELMAEKGFYKNSATVKILRQRKIMSCQLMKLNKKHINYIVKDLNIDIPNGRQEQIVKKLIEYYYSELNTR